jgi:uncharacterized protein YuzE
MIDFNFSYDSGEDDLFVYIKGRKSAGAIELGNFILDFDEKGDLVAMQILNASEVLSKILSKIIELSQIKQMQVEMINFRNMDAIKFKILTDSEEETANILIPHIKEKSPVLQY